MSESRITILVALAANVVLAIAKLVAGLVTGSAALLAEAAHSIADTVDQLALVAEGTSLLRAVRQVRSGASGSRDSLGRYVRELRDPAPRIVLLEDGAAVVGVILAAAGLIARDLTGNEAYDAAASIAIGVLLIGVAIAVGTHARDLLLGESARPEVREAIEAAALRHPAVEAVPALLTMHIGPDDLLVAANIELRDELTVTDAERVADEIAAELREAEPSVHHVFLQPSPGRPVS
jgi:divalent metal cation (Fe/Co/Zn/Cd) transporter